MANSLPISIRMGALPLNFQGTPQEIGDAIAARLTIVAQQSLALFVTGAAEPFSNVGPWLDTGTSPIGVWKNWDDTTGKYQPITLIDEQLGYILSVNQPDPTKFKLWIKLLSNGKADSINTYFGGAWTDIYTDKLAALQAAVDTAVTKPYGSSGKVYTSTGASTAPVWSDAPNAPVGVIYPYVGVVAPVNHLLCLGQVEPIATYPELFAVAGTRFGGDGISNFGIPDPLGRAFVGAGLGSAADATNWVVGDKRGTEGVIMTLAQSPKHKHGFGGLHLNTVDGTSKCAQAGNTASVNQSPDVSSTDEQGNDQAHPNIQPSIAINFIIKYR